MNLKYSSLFLQCYQIVIYYIENITNYVIQINLFPFYAGATFYFVKKIFWYVRAYATSYNVSIEASNKGKIGHKQIS